MSRRLNLFRALSCLAGCGKSLNRDDSPPQGLKPSLILHDLRGAKAPLYHGAAGFRDFFRSLLGAASRSPLESKNSPFSDRLTRRETQMYVCTESMSSLSHLSPETGLSICSDAFANAHSVDAS